MNLDVNGQCVDVWAEHPEDVAWECPHCTKNLPLYDHAEERTWRHLDSCQFQTHLHARIPRVACVEHGVVQVKVPWAEPRSRFTLLFERLADVGPVLRQLLTRTDDFLGGPDHLTFCDKLVRGQVPEQVLWAALILVEPPRFDDGLRLGE